MFRKGSYKEAFGSSKIRHIHQQFAMGQLETTLAPKRNLVAPQFKFWNNLPDELQLSVLRHNFTRRTPITARLHQQYFAPQLTKLSLVSWEMRGLALEVYYGGNTLIIDRSAIDATRISIFHTFVAADWTAPPPH